MARQGMMQQGRGRAMRELRAAGRKALLVTVIAAVVGGCAGTMQGIVRGEGTRLQFAYEQGMMSYTYTVEIDGEVFSGRSVMVDSGETFATAFGTTFAATSSTSSSATVIASSTSGRFKATLLGNRGSTLRCLMQYADSSGFTTSGGVGECIHSDGRVIDVVW